MREDRPSNTSDGSELKELEPRLMEEGEMKEDIEDEAVEGIECIKSKWRYEREDRPLNTSDGREVRKLMRRLKNEFKKRDGGREGNERNNEGC